MTRADSSVFYSKGEFKEASEVVSVVCEPLAMSSGGRFRVSYAAGYAVRACLLVRCDDGSRAAVCATVADPRDLGSLLRWLHDHPDYWSHSRDSEQVLGKMREFDRELKTADVDGIYDEWVAASDADAFDLFDYE